ncbi:MAG: serine/threonine protein kinase [Anaerolineae bacterium]|nr:serine/threonine protein kinase [Anaerolineae bacterium]
MNDSLIGTTIGGYEVLEEVGCGGMATVYRAHQLSMDRDVAIKVLPPQFLRQPTSLERFKQEASIVARLEHRAIVPVHDYGEHEGIPYIVMRYMDAGSVDELLAGGPIPPERTLAILGQIAPALDYAHREGVLHRDLKPSNILLDANDDAYITDFGIARILGTNTKPLTTSGVVGTPSYMSPEQAQGHKLDGRSDIYALGVVLFEMLTGVRPFEGETPYSVAVKHVTEKPPSACQINPKLTSAIEQVLFNVLAKNPDRRYQTAVDLTEALRAAIEQLGQAVPSGLIETEPSLNEALKTSPARPEIESPAIQPPPSSSVAPAVSIRRDSPNIQVMSRYVPSVPRAYTGSISRPRRRRKAARQFSWLTWATLALVIGGLVLAVALGSVYFILNSNDSNDDAPLSADYSSTAIFKLTATRQAIQGTNIPPDDKQALTPTAPLTNTPRLSERTPTASSGGTD